MKTAFLSLTLFIHATTTTAFCPSSSLMTSTPTSTTKATRSKETFLRNDLWGEPPQKDGENNKDMSKAIPFVPRPKLLDGTLAGDVGFDPYGFAGADKASLFYMREAEIKHSRLAMLACLGFPIAELFDKPIADAIGLPAALTKWGGSPSLVNGGLGKIDVVYWVAVAALAGIIELENGKMKEEKGKEYLPGDCNFDPLNLLPKDKEGQMAMMTKEIKHGRLAMMAILGFVAQEALYRTPIVNQIPFKF